jgi:hypothetical protein
MKREKHETPYFFKWLRGMFSSGVLRASRPAGLVRKPVATPAAPFRSPRAL